eukprot:332429_1
MKPKGVYVLAGYGPKIGHAVAIKFGQQGYKVALLSRTKSKLDIAVNEMAKLNIDAKGFPIDLSSMEQIKNTFNNISSNYGPIEVLHFNAITHMRKTLEQMSNDEIIFNNNVGINAFIQCIKCSINDLSKNKGCILSTGGGLSQDATTSHVSKLGRNTWSLSYVKAAQHNLVCALQSSLKKQNIRIYEVMVCKLVTVKHKKQSNEIAEMFLNLVKYGLKDDKFYITYPQKAENNYWSKL